MQLSKHFTLAELTVTQQRRLDNTPSEVIVARLKQTAERMEEVRKLLGGNPIIVTSGYRSPAVNKAVGSKPGSAHTQGWAVDFICPRYGTPLQICEQLGAKLPSFDQLIWEQTWVHISFDPRNRRQILTMRGGRYFPGLEVA